jgi:hypothetical protein
VRVERLWWQHQLKIRGVHLSTLADVPGCVSGEATLIVMREDRAVAEQFAAQITRRLSRSTPRTGAMSPQEQRSGPIDIAAIERRLRGPVLGFFVSGCLTCLFWFLMVLVHIATAHHYELSDMVFDVFFVGAASLGGLLVLGALSLQRMDAYPFAFATAIGAMVPLSPAWFISLPMGIWALMILLEADTKTVFVLRREGRESSAAAADRSPIALRREELDRIQLQVRGPALGLMLTGIVALGFWGFLSFMPIVNGHFSASEAVAFLCMAALAVAAATVVLLGGICLKNLEAHPLPIVASVLAMMPWSPAILIGFPVGVWALLVCRRPQVRGSFRRLVLPHRAEAAAPSPQAPQPMGLIHRKVRSFLLSMRSFIFASRVDDSSARPRGPIPTQDYMPKPDAEPPSS